MFLSNFNLNILKSTYVITVKLQNPGSDRIYHAINNL